MSNATRQHYNLATGQSLTPQPSRAGSPGFKKGGKVGGKMSGKMSGSKGKGRSK